MMSSSYSFSVWCDWFGFNFLNAGKFKMSPIHVKDVAKIFVQSIENGHAFKKVYELYIEYITDNSNPAIDVRYEIDGNAVPGGGSSALGLNQTLSGTSDKDDVNILKLSLTNPVKCRSISFRISSYSTTSFYFELISLGIRYRPLQVSSIATETSP